MDADPALRERFTIPVSLSGTTAVTANALLKNRRTWQKKVA